MTTSDIFVKIVGVVMVAVLVAIAIPAILVSCLISGMYHLSKGFRQIM